MLRNIKAFQSKAEWHFFFWEYFFLEIVAFWYYANEDSDDDFIGGSTKTVQRSIKNIYRNIGAVFFKLGTRIVHHKRSVMTPTMLLPWQY